MDLQDAGTKKSDMSDMPSVQRAEQPRTSPPGSRESKHMLRHSFCGYLPECSVSRTMTRLVLSKLETFFEVGKHEHWTRLGYFTDKLTP